MSPPPSYPSIVIYFHISAICWKSIFPVSCIFKGQHRLTDLFQWRFFFFFLSSSKEEMRHLVLCATKLTPSGFNSLQLRQGKKTPVEQCWLINHMLLIGGPPWKPNVTLFWNAHVPHSPLTPSRAFGFGESLMWVGLSPQFSSFTVQEAEWMYETNSDGGGHRGRNKAIWICGAKSVST